MKSLDFVPLRSERFVVTVKVAGVRRKIFQIVLRDRQGGVYVALPYFKYAQGILGHYIVPASEGRSTDIDLRVGGRTTSHRVKYSHHVDGEAHFSQDGRVFTSVRKQSVPLSQVAGHLFTVQLQGVEDFKQSTAKDDHAPDNKRTVIEFDFADASPRAVKLVGYWYTHEQLSALNPGPHTTPVSGPQVTFQTAGGKQSKGFLLAPPEDCSADRHMLLLTCEEIPQLIPNAREQ